MPLVERQHYDVAIIGSGITALSCAHHLLLQDRTLNIAIIGKHRTTSYLTPGLAYRSPKDSITRLYDSGGAAESEDHHEYYSKAFDYLVEFLNVRDHSSKICDFYRLGANHLEDEEIDHAQQLLRQFTTNSSSITRYVPNAKDLPFLQKRKHYTALKEADGLCVFSPQKLISSLKKSLRCQIFKDSVTFLDEKSAGVEVVCTNNNSIIAQMVVLACHDAVGQLEPFLESVVVPFSDQYCTYQTDFKASYAVSFQHGLHWKAQIGNICFLGGARYLRKHAGIGSVKASYSLKIEKHLLGLMHNASSTVRVLGRNAFLGVRPCDERPVIGPVPGKLRTLVASGYMQRGWTLGLFAGKSLAKIILEGECPELPRLFWPERFRF